MTSEDVGYLVFVYATEPDKSFKYPFKKSTSETQKLEEIFQAISHEKKCYFEFVDSFGRKTVPKESVEAQRIFQPFYITMMVPRLCKVKIKLLSGDKLSFEVDPMITLSSIMERIAKEKGFPKEQQKIYLGEKIMNSDQRLIDHELHRFDGDLKLELKSVLHIKKKGQCFDIYTDLGNPTMFLHFLIEAQTKIPAIQQSLCFQGKVLDTDKSLEASGVRNDSVLILEIKVRVIFSPLNGAAKAYYTPSTRISEIKADLNSQLAITDSIFQQEAYDFECDNKTLNEELTLAECHIEEEAYFKIKMRKEGVFIKLEEKVNKYAVGILRKESVGYLKSLLIEYCALNQETIKVFYKDKELEDQLTFESLETPQGGKPLAMKLEGKTIYLLKVKLPTTETILEIKIDVTTIVLHLKNEIERKGGPSIDNQRLFFKGKRLEDHKTIKSYHLISGAALDLVEIQTGENGGPGLQPKHIVPAFQIEENNLKDITPEWRYIRQPGLCVEGICEDEDCKAFNKWVIINRGICTYDLERDTINNDCPMCNSHVDITKYAFNNCSYSCVGVSEDFQKMIIQNPIDVGDEYKYLDKEILSEKNWSRFKIITNSLNNKQTRESCGICRERILDDRQELKCSHIYHNKCLNKIQHLEIPCIYCHF